MNRNTLDGSFLQNTFGYKNSTSASQKILLFLKKIPFFPEKLADSFIRITGLDIYSKWVLVVDRTYC